MPNPPCKICQFRGVFLKLSGSSGWCLTAFTGLEAQILPNLVPGFAYRGLVVSLR